MSREAEIDEAMLRAALAMARRGRGRTHPNPSVGAVVHRAGRILGRGTTRPVGGAHAEVVALEAARKRHGARAVRGASIAVTLEPCSFTGRTGACTDVLLEAGIARVAVGVRDPHPRVAGRGLARLRRRGVKVVTGLLEEACRREHRGFFSVCERGRPWLTLKLATSLDGRIATAKGESRWITSPPARAFVHRLRAEHDAVMVGSETALADDPELSVRRGDRVLRRPIRVLVDGRLRVPAGSRLFEPPGDPRTWVLCREGQRGRRTAARRAERVIELPAGEGRHVDLSEGARQLAAAGLTSVLLEGGGALAAACWRAGWVDEVHWLLAPRLLGEDARPSLGPLGLETLAAAPRLGDWRVRRLGPDLHVCSEVEALVTRAGSRSAKGVAGGRAGASARKGKTR